MVPGFLLSTNLGIYSADFRAKNPLVNHSTLKHYTGIELFNDISGIHKVTRRQNDIIIRYNILDTSTIRFDHIQSI